MSAQQTTAHARSLHQAMLDLRRGKITADEFRSVARASRASQSEADHDRSKFLAVANLVQR